MSYELEFIVMLPDTCATTACVGETLRQSDEQFPSKFIQHENDVTIVGTAHYPRLITIRKFPPGERDKDSFVGTSTESATTEPSGDTGPRNAAAEPSAGTTGFCITVTLDEPIKLEFQRFHIADILREKQSATHVYLVRDDVSRHLAAQLHPVLGRIEHNLRRYLNRFFLQVVGPDWLKTTAAPDVYSKMRTRRERDAENWKKLFDNELAYMDFSELGDLITKQSTGFSNPAELQQRIQQIRTLDELNDLKRDLESNYSKYFRETFQDRKFHKTWRKLTTIRHKVAHNGPLTSKEAMIVQEAETFMDRLLQAAELRMHTVRLSEHEQDTLHLITETADAALAETPGREADDYSDLRPKLKLLGNMDLAKLSKYGMQSAGGTVETYSEFSEADDDCVDCDIEREGLLAHLEVMLAEGRLGKKRFLAKSTFVRELQYAGYSWKSISETLHRLRESGEIEIYSYDGPHSLKATTAIRLVHPAEV